MHLCSILLSVAMAATFVKAGHQSCLTQNEASSIIQGFTDLLTKTQANFNHTLATQLLASDFHTNSDGVDYVREEPVSQHLNRMTLHFYIGDLSEPALKLTLPFLHSWEARHNLHDRCSSISKSWKRHSQV